MSDTETDGGRADNDADSTSHESQHSTNTSQSQSGSITQEPYITQLETEQQELEQRLEELQRQRQSLVSSINGVDQSELSACDCSDAELERAVQSAQDTIKEHIRLLGDYNEIKDIAQGLVGFLAEQRSARIKDVMNELGFDADD